MEGNSESIREVIKPSDEAVKSDISSAHPLEQPHPPNTHASTSSKTLPSYPVRDCNGCSPEEGLHTNECYATFALTLKDYTRAANEALLPDQLKSISTAAEPERSLEEMLRSADTSDSITRATPSLISPDPTQDPTSSLENFARYAAEFKAKQTAQLKELDEKEALATMLYHDLLSYYRCGSHELFDTWHEALEAVLKCAVEKWELKREAEEVSVRAARVAEERLAKTKEEHGGLVERRVEREHLERRAERELPS
jgi:hypothetical protein